MLTVGGAAGLVSPGAAPLTYQPAAQAGPDLTSSRAWSHSITLGQSRARASTAGRYAHVCPRVVEIVSLKKKVFGFLGSRNADGCSALCLRAVGPGKCELAPAAPACPPVHTESRGVCAGGAGRGDGTSCAQLSAAQPGLWGPGLLAPGLPTRAGDGSRRLAGWPHLFAFSTAFFKIGILTQAPLVFTCRELIQILDECCSSPQYAWGAGVCLLGAPGCPLTSLGFCVPVCPEWRPHSCPAAPAPWSPGLRAGPRRRAWRHLEGRCGMAAERCGPAELLNCAWSSRHVCAVCSQIFILR